MDDGNDVVKLAEAAAGGSQSFPLDMTAHVNGGNGNDFLHGGDEQDVFFSGPTGEDHLFGNKGGDALLSESRKWPKKDCSALSAKQQAENPRCTENKPDAKDYTDGADELFGGPGDDQLVIDYPCGKHHYSGGSGKDIAGFARSGRFDIHAQFAGKASIATEFHGKAFNPQLCTVASATRLEDDLEILEAADGNDNLWGNDDANVIWGREGDDRIHGLGGDDTLEGLVGDDWIYGGAGNDKLQGAGGDNRLFQDAE
jgi:Ca2+-binding RTX toxin-like protein